MPGSLGWRRHPIQSCCSSIPDERKEAQPDHGLRKLGSRGYSLGAFPSGGSLTPQILGLGNGRSPRPIGQVRNRM